MTSVTRSSAAIAASRIVAMTMLVALFTACSPSGDPSTGTPADAGVESANENFREVIVGGTSFPGTAGEQQWLDFQRDAEEVSDGDIRMRMLIYGQLGAEENIVSGLRRGRVHFANLSALVTSTLVPEIALLYAPYLFSNELEADFIYDNYLTDIFAEMLAEQDLQLVSWYEIGFHHIYAKTPLLTPADAVGRRYRVSSALSSRLFAEAVGADVIPLAFSEIVSSLQTGLIEAGDNGVSLYTRTGTAGEAPHLTLTGHMFGMSIIVSRKRWWDDLAEEERRILVDAFPTAETTRVKIRAEMDSDLENGLELGIVVHELSEEQLAEWRAATADVTQVLIDEIGGRAEEVYALILEGRRAYQALQASATTEVD